MWGHPFSTYVKFSGKLAYAHVGTYQVVRNVSFSEILRTYLMDDLFYFNHYHDCVEVLIENLSLQFLDLRHTSTFFKRIKDR